MTYPPKLLNYFFQYVVFAILFISSSTQLKSQCITPVGMDTTICSEASIPLAATSSGNLLRWYDSATDFSFLDTGSVYTTPIITATQPFYVAEFDTGTVNKSLRFDGSNDYIPISDFEYNSTGYTEVTVESWIRTSNGNNQIIASYDRSEYWRFEINGTGAGTGQIGFDILTDAGQLDFGGNIRVDDGLWHHVAAVFDNGTVSIYVDGILDVSTTLGTTFGIGSTRYGFVGVGSEADVYDGTTGPNDYFDGDMGFFRLWDVARTQLEIQQSMNSCLLGPTPGLIIDFQMDGSGTQNYLTDYSGSKYNGFLSNFALPGAWLATGPSLNSCAICESTRDPVEVELFGGVQNFSAQDTCIAGNSLLLDAGPGFSSYLWQDNSTNQTFNVSQTGIYSVKVNSTGMYGTTSCESVDSIRVFINEKPLGIDSVFCGGGNYSITAAGSNGLYKWYNSISSTTILDTGNLDLLFNNTDTFYVASYDTLRKSNALSFSTTNNGYGAINGYSYQSTTNTELTVETWIRTTNQNDQIIASFDRSEYWRLEINGDGGGNGRIGFGIRTNAGVEDFGSSARVDDGLWHHVAVVFNNGNIRIYIDGTLDNSTNRGATFGTGVTRFGFLGTGSEAPTYNGSRGPNDYFDGDMATFSVWERALTPAEISQNRFKCKLGSENGLVIDYNFTEGEGNLINDNTGNNRNSLLQNITFTTAWLEDGPTIYGCASECESERDSVIVIINPAITNSDVIVNCPGVDSTLVSINPIGGSGNFDYQELSSAFVFDGIFEPNARKKRFLNNSAFQVVIKDDNECFDTTVIFNTPATPTVIASASSTGACRILDQDEFAFVVNGSNQVIAAIKSENEDLGQITGEVFVNSNALIFNGEAYLGRNYLINSDSNSFTTTQVRLFYTDTEYNDLVTEANTTAALNDNLSLKSDLGTTKYNGPTEDGTYDPTDATGLVFIPQASTGSSFSSNYMEFSLTSFSEFWIHASGSNTPLPIELLSFKAQKILSDVTLIWKTSSEINNDYFVLERADNNAIFYEITRINGAGNSSTVREYRYVDRKDRTRFTYYRLKQVDFNGEFSYSPIVVVTEEEKQDDQLVVYPNPTKYKLSVNHSATKFGNFQIIDARGIIQLERTSSESGNSTIDVSNLTPGVYFLKFNSKDSVKVSRFVIR
tara:strand:- start:1134 stop:4619 length:3486 start_codon:yes stop_codon:yes gene_type:complete